MIHRPFTPPNFLCRVSDPLAESESIEKRLEFARSEDELRKRLEGGTKKLKVHSIEAYDFNQWKQRAQEETRKAVEAIQKGETYTFKSSLWGELKDYLFSLFDGKCAYCESVVEHVASGDVEHYRPKKKVEEDGRHSGYYWLAYDIDNYLPCCEKCNRARAKMNHFPIKGERAYQPQADLSKEKPLLLNPYTLKDLSSHVKFIVNNEGLFPGTVKGIDDFGEHSVRIYNLNREGLRSERSKAEEAVVCNLELAAVKGTLPSLFLDLKSGTREYSAACLAVAANWWDQFKKSIEHVLTSETTGDPGK